MPLDDLVEFLAQLLQGGEVFLSLLQFRDLRLQFLFGLTQGIKRSLLRQGRILSMRKRLLGRCHLLGSLREGLGGFRGRGLRFPRHRFGLFLQGLLGRSLFRFELLDLPGLFGLRALGLNLLFLFREPL